MTTSLNLRDYEEAATERLPQMVFEYFAGGANDELTLNENLAAWSRLRWLAMGLLGRPALTDLDRTLLA